MLAAIDLGIQVVQPLHGAGLGEYTRGTATRCRDSEPGANFICKDVGGEFACWPCSQAELAVFRGFEAEVWIAQFSPDGKRIAIGSWDGTVRLVSADGTGAAAMMRFQCSRVPARMEASSLMGFLPAGLTEQKVQPRP